MRVGTSAATGRRRHPAVAAGAAAGVEDVGEMFTGPPRKRRRELSPSRSAMEEQCPPFVAARAATTEDDVGGAAARGSQ